LTEKNLSAHHQAVTDQGKATATFGGNMRREREMRGLTLEEVARRLGLQRPSNLSTLERSSHVPKADTIKEYAAAIGCEPAALLAGVLTEYDILRGAAVPTTPILLSGQQLRPFEIRALRVLRRMSVAGQRIAVSRLSGVAAAFPIDGSQESAERNHGTHAGKASKGRGKRKVAG
jgi:transcriptional regulator with XRE-family HTH domain